MPVTAEELIDALRAARAETARLVSAMDPARLGAPSPWRGAMPPIGFMVGWLAEADETRRVRIESDFVSSGTVKLSVAQRALVAGAPDFGRLLGTFAGVTPELFDRQPAPGEWGMREALAHVIAVDKRYLIAIEHAVVRRNQGDEGPLRPPADSLPPNSGETERHGTMTEMLARLAATHDQIVRRVGPVGDSYLDAPTEWVSLDVDVRFRIHRFAAHDREHTAHIRKIQQQLGWQQNEPQLLLADAHGARAALETLLTFTANGLSEDGATTGSRTVAELVRQALDDEGQLQAALS